MAEPILPPKLDPRGPRRPERAGRAVTGGGSGGPSSTRGWRRPLGITAAVLAVLVLAASGVLYTRYLHYDHNLTRAAGVIKPGKRLTVVEAKVHSHSGADAKLVAVALATIATIEREGGLRD